MKVEQKFWTAQDGWKMVSSDKLPTSPQWVMVFGGRSLVGEQKVFDEIKDMYPQAALLLCSTAGEIMDTQVRDGSLALSAVWFEKTTVKFSSVDIADATASYDAGTKMAHELIQDGLVHVMVFSDGLNVNGTQLVKGFNDTLPANISVTGGLVGDESDFKQTLVGLNEPGKEHKIVAIGFYGTQLRVGYGSKGGWDPFGIERTITKSKGNVLYELDGQPALKLYKDYLGELAKGLPSAGLLFPLQLRIKSGDKEVEVVRTILGVNENDQSITFAGDMPEGVQAALMKANFERLIDGASVSGKMSLEALQSQKAQLAILISCIGRKLVLKERTEEELEAVRSELGPQAAITGFYSYGELSPVSPAEKQCELHNQTMTITTFSEA